MRENLKSGSVRGLIALSELILHQEVGYEFYSTQIPDTLDELAKETMEILNLKKKGISLTVEDFLIHF